MQRYRDYKTIVVRGKNLIMLYKNCFWFIQHWSVIHWPRKIFNERYFQCMNLNKKIYFILFLPSFLSRSWSSKSMLSRDKSSSSNNNIALFIKIAFILFVQNSNYFLCKDLKFWIHFFGGQIQDLESGYGSASKLIRS